MGDVSRLRLDPAAFAALALGAPLPAWQARIAAAPAAAPPPSPVEPGAWRLTSVVEIAAPVAAVGGALASPHARNPQARPSP